MALACVGCRAEIERETLKQKAMAEAEARAHEARLSEDVNRRLLLEKAQKETEKWVSAINTTFSHIGGQCAAPGLPCPSAKRPSVEWLRCSLHHCVPWGHLQPHYPLAQASF